jgi:hypothetical protein
MLLLFCFLFLQIFLDITTIIIIIREVAEEKIILLTHTETKRIINYFNIYIYKI